MLPGEILCSADKGQTNYCRNRIIAEVKNQMLQRENKTLNLFLLFVVDLTLNGCPEMDQNHISEVTASKWASGRIRDMYSPVVLLVYLAVTHTQMYTRRSEGGLRLLTVIAVQNICPEYFPTLSLPAAGHRSKMQQVFLSTVRSSCRA